MIWRLVRALLFRLDAELAHHVTMNVFAAAMVLAPVAAVCRGLFGARDPRLRCRVAGLELPGPIGLGAGFDKEARWFNALDALGFGFVEVGTLTAHGQDGNPKPRVFRLPADRALINRMGFNNGGSAEAAARLAGARIRPVLGVNIGKSKVTPNEDALGDYAVSLDRLYPFAAYVTVNVSSPNTAGLRDLQEAAALRSLLGGLLARRDALAAAAGEAPKPLFVKIAPDLDDDARDAVVDLAVELRLDGIIATNTTLSRAGLATPGHAVESIGAGGLSGAPLTPRSRAFVAALYRRAAGRLPIIGVGGVMCADDAWEMIRAGASAVQVYTGFVYGGPGFVATLNRGIAARLAERGVTLDAVVGEATRA